MKAATSPEAALAAVPGWEGASWEPMSGGFNNRSYRVTQGARQGVLKIDDTARRLPFGSRAAESAVQSLAADAGLAGPVLFASEGAYLTEYLEGVVWDTQCFELDENIDKLAAALRRLHALPLTNRCFDATAAAHRYAKHIDATEQNLVALCIDVTRKRRLPRNLCCCHNDLVAENIIATPAIRFLDWEYACDNDPFFDLATLVEHHELSEQQVARLLDGYFDGDGDGDGARWREQLAGQQALYRALLWLWLASLTNTDPDELQRVGERVLTSCS